jgi:hypothetical protein
MRDNTGRPARPIRELEQDLIAAKGDPARHAAIRQEIRSAGFAELAAELDRIAADTNCAGGCCYNALRDRCENPECECHDSAHAGESAYTVPGDAERTAAVEEDAAELAGVRAEEAAELAAEAGELAGDGPRCAFCGNLYAACVCAYPPASVSLARHGGGVDPVAALDQLGVKWSPDLGNYATGEMRADQIRCALCANAPCQCPPFGTDAYFALVSRRHGRAES